MPDDVVDHPSALTRRRVVLGVTAASALAAVGWPGPAAAAPRDGAVTITVMGTSDLHANVVNWDYYKDATYTDSAGNAVGLVRVASVVAVNNYRQSGGGGFPHIASAPVVYNAQVAIREAFVAHASASGTIDPASFHVENWRLVRNGVPVF
ncbi:hypothetical protein ACOCJ7_09040 [Knoellia sp. CPCC 206453]|uniref:hypothetical protein n=1 Tax=Knoellia pratensis TaxID=3404796 RepID=UPI00361C7623